jgi:hypothetical protein
MLLHVG